MPQKNFPKLLIFGTHVQSGIWVDVHLLSFWLVTGKERCVVLPSWSLFEAAILCSVPSLPRCSI